MERKENYKGHEIYYKIYKDKSVSSKVKKERREANKMRESLIRKLKEDMEYVIGIIADKEEEARLKEEELQRQYDAE